jgi:hypothetical protein
LRASKSSWRHTAQVFAFRKGFLVAVDPPSSPLLIVLPTPSVVVILAPSIPHSQRQTLPFV